MEKIAKEKFEAWKKKADWLLVGEGPSPTGGRQETYVTPSGNLIAVNWELDGKHVNSFGLIVPAQPQSLPGSLRGFMGRG
jgi:hypothetical protein